MLTYGIPHDSRGAASTYLFIYIFLKKENGSQWDVRGRKYRENISNEETTETVQIINRKKKVSMNNKFGWYKSKVTNYII